MTTRTSGTRDEPVGSVSEETPKPKEQLAPSSSTWGENAVPLRDVVEQTEEREREERLRLVTGLGHRRL